MSSGTTGMGYWIALPMAAILGLAASSALATDLAVGDADLSYTGSVAMRPDTGSLQAGWTIQIRDDDLQTISFALNSSFGTARVSGDDVRDVTSALDPRFDGFVRLYDVELAPSVSGRDRIVRFTYGGPLFGEEPPLPINTLDPDKVELTVDSFWFPFDARFETDLIANLRILIAGDWSGVGVEMIEPIKGGFKIRQDVPSFDIAFSLLSSSTVVRAPGYVIHDARADQSGAKLPELTQALEFCTGFLNDFAGPAGPLPQASIIVTGRPDGGYSRGTLIALTDIENEDEEALHQFICHELAHYWSHANAGGPENWINEGVADYLANMGVRDALGEDVFQARMARYAEQLKGRDLPPIRPPDATDRPPFLNMYRAAPLALQALEERMGRADFARFMRAMMVEQTATTPDLLAGLEGVAGAETRAWFAERLND